MTVSQIATGEENDLSFRIYTEKGAVKWAQENPNYLEIFRYGEERRTLTRGSGYLSPAAAGSTRVPVGHPEGYLEAFATIYDGFTRAVRAHIDGQPLAMSDYTFPNVRDGLRGMEFIHAAVESAKRNAAWVDLPNA
jgi:predicted dehydrogenase